MSKIPASVEDVVTESFQVRDVIYYEDKIEFLLERIGPDETKSRFEDLYLKLRGMGLIPKLFLDGWELKLLISPAPEKGTVSHRLRYALAITTLLTVVLSAWFTSFGTSSLLREIGMGVDPVGSMILHSAGILAFLLAHEVGHMLRWRGKYEMDLIIPAPPPPFGFGTFGDLLIRNRPFINREEALDVSLCGILMGLLAGFVISVLGLLQSTAVPTHIAYIWIEQEKAGILPTPLTFFVLENLINVGEGKVLLLSPLALAGLGALLITFFISMPILPWDGGHAALLLLGGRIKWAGWIAVIGVFLINPLLGALMLAAKLMPTNPPILDEYSEIPSDKRKKGLLTYLLAIMFSVPILQ